MTRRIAAKMTKRIGRRRFLLKALISGSLPRRLLPLLGLLLLCGLMFAPPAMAQSQDLAELSAQGKAALRDQQFDRAEKVYEQVVKLDPRSAEAHSDLGLALYMLGMYSRATTELHQAL